MSSPKTTEEYKKQLKIVNPNLIVLELYIGDGRNIKHKCRVCKHIWSPTPSNCLRGNGCPKCSHPSKRYSHEEFVKKVASLHGNFFTFQEEYKKATQLLRAICKYGHEVIKPARQYYLSRKLKSHGCKTCGKMQTAHKLSYKLKEYKKALKLAQGNNIKLVSKVYKNKPILKRRLKFKCLKGHVFWARTGSMIKRKRPRRCPICYACQSNIAIEAIELLAKKTRLVFQHAINSTEHIIKDTRYKADGYNKTYNLIIEYHGDYWHGGKKGKDNMIKYKKTLERDRVIRSKSYNLIRIWEWQYKKDKEKCIARLAQRIEAIKLQFR